MILLYTMSSLAIFGLQIWLHCCLLIRSFVCVVRLYVAGVIVLLCLHWRRFVGFVLVWCCVVLVYVGRLVVSFVLRVRVGFNVCGSVVERVLICSFLCCWICLFLFFQQLLCITFRLYVQKHTLVDKITSNVAQWSSWHRK